MEKENMSVYKVSAKFDPVNRHSVATNEAGVKHLIDLNGKEAFNPISTFLSALCGCEQALFNYVSFNEKIKWESYEVQIEAKRLTDFKVHPGFKEIDVTHILNAKDVDNNKLVELLKLSHSFCPVSNSVDPSIKHNVHYIINGKKM
ncbi:OsmC family protein [Mycoplasma sp. Mirounga ES2805-ORL]|uniref:OsmC family protein n=1 Tax=Mycoplasma sp. Mirounga ES2805-ORL TaxID=754514 RepID=UPI00197CA4E1|nr:OsmC family protein [Mycoplasma sp. Mirounga ES2805-ORL]QSF13684.1 OsmC family protein [Mycoplasma sp. Mirounga ES2805-ORL]